MRLVLVYLTTIFQLLILCRLYWSSLRSLLVCVMRKYICIYNASNCWVLHNRIHWKCTGSIYFSVIILIAGFNELIYSSCCNRELWASRGGFDSRRKQKFFLYLIFSGQVLSHIKPPVHWLLRALSVGYSWKGEKLKTPLHIEPSMRRLNCTFTCP